MTRSYFGALVGRYGNPHCAWRNLCWSGRLTGWRKITANNSLHGGIKGFNKALWTAKISPGKRPVFSNSLTSAKPARKDFRKFESCRDLFLDRCNALMIDLSRQTDKPTVVNLTTHAYFNLAAMFGDILDTCLRFKPMSSLVDAGYPTGELRVVAGTPFDFRSDGDRSRASIG